MKRVKRKVTLKNINDVNFENPIGFEVFNCRGFFMRTNYSEKSCVAIASHHFHWHNSFSDLAGPSVRTSVERLLSSHEKANPKVYVFTNSNSLLRWLAMDNKY